MVKVSVPNFFRCPISLELMMDPVNLCTGQVYDRRSIENWFVAGHKSCPSTMQVLKDTNIVPNHLLRRMIQDWCASNPAVRPPAAELSISEDSALTRTMPEKGEVKQFLSEAMQLGSESARILRDLRSLAKRSDGNRTQLLEAGLVKALCTILFTPANLSKHVEACQQALALLVLVPMDLIQSQTGIGQKQLGVISWLLCRGSLDSRVNVALLLESLMAIDSSGNKTGAGPGKMKSSLASTAGVLEGMIQLLKEDSYPRAVGAGLKCCLALLRNEKEILKAVEAGLHFITIELLQKSRGRNAERAVTLLDLICSVPEGQVAVAAHALAVPILAKHVTLQGSTLTTEKCISCLLRLCSSRSGLSGGRSIDEAVTQEGLLDALSTLRSYTSTSDCSAKAVQQATYLKALLRYRLKRCI